MNEKEIRKILKEETEIPDNIDKAMEVPIMEVISGEQSGSTDITVQTTETSFLRSFGNSGRIGLSITRETNIAFSVGLPSLFKKDPGIFPIAYIFSS